MSSQPSKDPIDATAWHESHSCTLITVESLQETWEQRQKDIESIAENTEHQNKTIYEALRDISSASVFVKHLDQCSELVHRLQDTSQEHTIWVPTNEAFENVDSGIFNDASQLESVLSLHISPHYIPASRFYHMPNVPTILYPAKLNGPLPLRIRPSESGVRINIGGLITQLGIKTANGLINIIDRVVLPPVDLSIFVKELAAKPYTETSTFINLLLSTSVISSLSTAKGLTIFIPSDAAMSAYTSSHPEHDLSSNDALIERFVKYHIIPNSTLYSNMLYPKNVTEDRIKSTDPPPRLLKGKRAFTMPTMLGQDAKGALDIAVIRYAGLISMSVKPASESEEVNVDAADVTIQDLAVADGVVHIVDKVLVPANFA